MRNLRDQSGAVEVPVGRGPPPHADYLPPLSDEQRQAAGLQMLAAVVAGLAVIFVLLRLVAGRRAAPAEKTPEQHLVERVEEALGGREHDSDTTDDP